MARLGDGIYLRSLVIVALLLLSLPSVAEARFDRTTWRSTSMTALWPSRRVRPLPTFTGWPTASR
jgi:hypothetical protein